MFIPKNVYYEEKALEYPLGRELFSRFDSAGIPCFKIENHNNIEFMRSKPNSEFARMKQDIVIGVRKTHRYVPNSKTSDFLVPYTSSGCGAMCLYCYLVCNFNKCSYLRLFVNREQMLGRLIKTAAESDRELTFEIGSNSDLVLENTITGNLKWTIEGFSKVKKGYITLPTKFDMIDDIIKLEHRGRCIIRMSLNPEEIIKKVEFGTSSLEKRIAAIKKLIDAGYKVGILIAPVIMIDDWKSLYEKLIERLCDSLSEERKRGLFFEIIFMTYSYIHRKINEEAFPAAIDLYSKEKMTGRGRGKYMYKAALRNEGEEFFRAVMSKYFPENEICYIV